MHPILIAWIAIGGFIGGIIQIIYSMTDTDDISFYNAFWFAIDFYETYHDQINCVGMTLAIIIISVFVLPGSLAIVFLVMFGKLLSCFWRGFMYIFKKRNIKQEKTDNE